HQVFLREYQFLSVDPDGGGPLGSKIVPVNTGELLTNRTAGADGHMGTGDEVEIGGMATWGVVKAQARDVLGINLTDKDVFDVPLLATDPYGNFIPGPNGFPQVVVRLSNGADGLAGTADDQLTLVEGNPASPVDLQNPIAGNPNAVVVRTGHQFLIDIAHDADPTGGAVADNDDIAGQGAVLDPSTGHNLVYDDDLLD